LTDTAFAPRAFPVVRSAALAELEERTRAAAYAAGHAEGYADGVARAHEEQRAWLAEQELRERERAVAAEQERESALRALRSAVAGFEALLVPGVEQAQDALVEAALQLAEAVLGHELVDGHRAARSALSRAIGAVDPSSEHTVRLSPEDCALLREDPRSEGLRLQPDPALARGDAVVVLAEGHIDARIATALQRATAALREER